MSRDELLAQLQSELFRHFQLVLEADATPSRCGEELLFQAECDALEAIGTKPGITTTEMAGQLEKSVSACSQIIKKLIHKKLVRQQLNPDNRRQYYLYLTKKGEASFWEYEKHRSQFGRILGELVDRYGEEDLSLLCEMQSVINEMIHRHIHAKDTKIESGGEKESAT